ncbi:MAG: 50S ribosomal protein L1 [Chloroflexota bacterium]
MPSKGKKYQAAAQMVDKTPRSLEDAIALLRRTSWANFDETVELHVTTSADPRHADQQVREVALLPHGTGRQVRVMVFASGDAANAAREAGADYIADDETIRQIENGWADFEASIATPDQMGRIGRLGRYLGRRGLMPNPRTGTVVQPDEIGRAIEEVKKGRTEVRMDRTAVIHTRIGKLSFTDQQLLENLQSVLTTIVNARPSAVKGLFIKNATLTATMGPAIRLDVSEIQAAPAAA